MALSYDDILYNLKQNIRALKDAFPMTYSLYKDRDGKIIKRTDFIEQAAKDGDYYEQVIIEYQLCPVVDK